MRARRIDPDTLPRAGELVLRPDSPDAVVVACTGWTWPVTRDEPSHIYATTDAGEELRVIPARDAQGSRFWLAERRA